MVKLLVRDKESSRKRCAVASTTKSRARRIAEHACGLNADQSETDYLPSDSLPGKAWSGDQNELSINSQRWLFFYGLAGGHRCYHQAPLRHEKSQTDRRLGLFFSWVLFLKVRPSMDQRYRCRLSCRTTTGRFRNFGCRGPVLAGAGCCTAGWGARRVCCICPRSKW